MKKWKKITLAILILFVGYLIWIENALLEGKNIGEDIFTEILCVSQSTFENNCEINIQTTCSNIACVSSENYERCIKPGIRDDGWSSLSDKDPYCVVSPSPWLKWSHDELCETRWYPKRTSLEELKVGDNLEFFCENLKSVYRCECMYVRLIY